MAKGEGTSAHYPIPAGLASIVMANHSRSAAGRCLTELQDAAQARKEKLRSKFTTMSTEATPRINARYLDSFTNSTVRILGKVTSLRGESATIDAKGSVELHLNRVPSLPVSLIYPSEPPSKTHAS
ncbi:MAG: hypothetical protein Q9183_001135 [Haloplaca sp. 2 TL-2023]